MYKCIILIKLLVNPMAHAAMKYKNNFKKIEKNNWSDT